MAADLQEPPELMLEASSNSSRPATSTSCVGRATGAPTRGGSVVTSQGLLGLYRRHRPAGHPAWRRRRVRLHPRGGATADPELDESHTSLVALLYWVGFRRVEVPYDRVARTDGQAARGPCARRSDTSPTAVFSFTDLPIHALLAARRVRHPRHDGSRRLVVLVAWLTGRIDSPGYTPLMLTMLFSDLSGAHSGWGSSAPTCGAPTRTPSADRRAHPVPVDARPQARDPEPQEEP